MSVSMVWDTDIYRERVLRMMLVDDKSFHLSILPQRRN